MGTIDELFNASPQNVTMLSCPQPTPCVFRFQNSPLGVVVLVESAVHCEGCQAELGATLREIADAIRRRGFRAVTRRMS